MRLLIVDDDERVRDALSMYFDTYDEFVVVGKAGDGAEAVRLCEQLRPDVVLMDLNMPVMDGVRATRHICERFPHITIIVLTNSWDNAQLDDARQAGATAIVLKGARAEQIAWTIKHALERLHLPPFYHEHHLQLRNRKDQRG